jgi:ATP-binding cassette, subfamily B, bacterial
MNLKSIFKHYWKFLGKRTLSQSLILIFYAVGALGTTVVVPIIYKKIIDIVSLQPESAHQELSQLVVWLVLVVVSYNVFFRIADYLLVTSQSEIIKEIHDYCLEKLQKHSYSFFSNSFVGGLVAKTKRFVYAFELLHDQFIFNVWMSGIALISSVLVLLFQSWVLGLAFISWILLYSIMVYLMVKWQIPKNLANAQADTRTVSRYADIISNILTIKTFGSSKRELEKFQEVTSNQEKKRRSAWLQQNFWNSMLQSATIGIFNIAIIWFSIDLWKNGAISAGTIVLVQVYVITSFNIVWSISKNVIRISSALSEADEMVRILDQEPEIKDPVNPEKVSITQGLIEFKNVFFKYHDSSHIFRNLNLVIKPGEKVALVGHSGAGKTTIVKLILRFADIQEGEIIIDGQRIKDVNQEELREKISYVPQEPLLFHRSVLENISYAKPSASFSEIVNVSEKAQAKEFIENLPRGYNSLVGERGIKLSGGERQRIAIARAMLKNSPIVILDEATSSLDSLAEEKIQKALDSLIKNKTTIVIAHRLSTIKKMDRIIVFDNGEIKESGSHLSLLKKKGIYSKLWKSQVGGFILQE